MMATPELAAIPRAPRNVSSTVGRVRTAVDGLSDEALLAGLALGDPAVEVAFVRRFQRRVYGLAVSMVSEPTLAEEIAQEALLRAWRHAAVFDPRRGSVSTWLLAITRHLAIDSLRLRRAVPTDPAAMVDVLVDSGDRGPEEAALADDSASRVRTAIAALPPEQARAVVLASFLGRTAQEIASAEGIPLGTAKTRVRAAMGKLRAALVQERGPA